MVLICVCVVWCFKTKNQPIYHKGYYLLTYVDNRKITRDPYYDIGDYIIKCNTKEDIHYYNYQIKRLNWKLELLIRNPNEKFE